MKNAAESMEPVWSTNVSEIDDEFSSLYGYSVDDLAGHCTFTESIFLAWTGNLPTPQESAMLDKLLVLGIAHGVAPSGAVTRSLVACGSPIQGALAASVLTMADIHGGAGEETARLLQEDGVAAVQAHGAEKAAQAIVQSFRDTRTPVPGFGHPFHRGGDPRGRFLLDSASKIGIASVGCELVGEMEKALAGVAGGSLKANVDGAAAAILTDLGIDWRFSRPLMILSRLPTNSAHAVEEMTHRTPNWRDLVLRGEKYTGPSRRDVEPRPMACDSADERTSQ